MCHGGEWARQERIRQNGASCLQFQRNWLAEFAFGPVLEYMLDGF